MNLIEIIGKSNLLKKAQIIDLANDSLIKKQIIDSELEIIFTDKAEIEDLNNKHRQINKPTDVLSFPQINLKNEKHRMLGSIVINEEMVLEKEEKIDDVIKHGILHLLGYDHETDEAEWDSAAKEINCNL